MNKHRDCHFLYTAYIYIYIVEKKKARVVHLPAYAHPYRQLTITIATVLPRAKRIIAKKWL